MRHLMLAIFLVGATPALAAAETAHARGDQAAILATMDTLFDALARKDVDALATVTIAEGRATGTKALANGTTSVRSQSWVDFGKRLLTWRGKAVEKMINPHVHVDGAMAMIWSDYTFTIDGKFSHCGTDHVDLVKQDGGWRVLNLTWSQRPMGCPGK